MEYFVDATETKRSLLTYKQNCFEIKTKVNRDLTCLHKKHYKKFNVKIIAYQNIEVTKSFTKRYAIVSFDRFIYSFFRLNEISVLRIFYLF